MNVFSEKKTGQVPTKTNAFFKGGCGCLILFAALAFLALIIPGGAVHIHGNPILVFLFLFLIGGGLGLFVRWIYKKGFNAGENE